MSGLGPAACWLAHKRLESWSRMAKERVDAVRRATERNISGDEGDEKSTTPPPSATSSIASGCDSNGSYDFTTDSEVLKYLEIFCFQKFQTKIYISQECNLTRDPQPIQPMSSGSSHSINPDILRSPLDLRSSPLHSHLQHQSKSFPPRLQRTPSVSSQSSLDSAPSRQSVSGLFYYRTYI